MNRIKTIKCIGAAGVLFAGVFAASFASAGGNGNDDVASLEEGETQEWGYGGGYYNDDDDDYRRRRYYDDDDDDYRRRRRYYHDDDDDRRRRRYRRYRRHRRHYYWNETSIGVTDLAFHDLGAALEAEVTISGITGEAPVKVDIEAMADLSAACGQALLANDQLDIQSDGSQSFEQGEVQAGELTVVVDTNEALLDCQDVEYLDARIDVSQGDEVLTLLCTFTAPTLDGEIADENIECSAF